MTMWEQDADRLALVELAETGRLRRRSGQDEAWVLLAELAWTCATGRRDEIALVPEHRAEVLALLDRVWPDWTRWRDALLAHDLEPTPSGWRTLQDMLRVAGVGRLPDRLNRRTASSAVGPHSKSRLGAIRRAALGPTTLTRDGIVRLRPPDGLRVRRGDVTLDAAEVAAVLGELTISERALLDGTEIEGPIAAVLLVENLGPYQDLDAPPGWLVVHVPGWNTSTVRAFLGTLHGKPVVHFGDLDPAGVRMVRHLRQAIPSLLWAVPDFWREHLEARALEGGWPEDLDLEAAPPLVRELATRGLWLEQEILALDPRLGPALETLVATTRR